MYVLYAAFLFGLVYISCSNEFRKKQYFLKMACIHIVTLHLSAMQNILYNIYIYIACSRKGAEWLSDRVIDSIPRGRGFEPHRRHCVVVLEQDTIILA